MHREFTSLQLGQTVGDALNWLRSHPPSERIIYFYVVDEAGRLQGVVPTRRLVLSPPETPIADMMVRRVVALPAEATVLEACEFFIQHRMLAFPVVDADKRVVGVVDIDLYTEELSHLDRATPVARMVAPLVRFMHVESAGGLVLLLCTMAALVLANSSLAGLFQALWQRPFGVTLGEFTLQKPLLLWINDGLMALFFFVVGLEIKRELVSGELADPRKALLPIVAALGGMIVPAILFSVFLWGRPGSHGWGVPMATDIAFVVGFLTLLGTRVPAGLKLFLLTLAIADDLGSVLVIAFAYTTDLHPLALGFAAIGVALVLFFRAIGIRAMAIYALVGFGIWFGFLKSGLHPTLAGVLLGFLTPARPKVRQRVLLDIAGDLFARLRQTREGHSPATLETLSPAERLENMLHPWVAFVIMPLFALANADVTMELAGLSTPVAMGIAVGLVLGKPLGIVLFSWISVRLGMTRLPRGLNWKMMIGAGCLGGIGFTMSLFIAGLAYQDILLGQAKIGILFASTLSAVLGCLILWFFLPSNANSEEEFGEKQSAAIVQTNL
jgi:NhaA family Na+:H+ antiporter